MTGVPKRKFEGLCCVLCEVRPSSKEGEHADPQWFLEAFPEQVGRFTVHESNKRARKPDGALRPRQKSFPRTTLPVCTECNGRLNTRFEVPTKPVIRAIWQGRLALGPADAWTFAVWTLKTWLMVGHPSAVCSDPGWSIPRYALDEVPDDLYGWTVSETKKPPPHGLSAWVTKDGEEQSDHSTGAIPLPTVVADGVTTKFQVLRHSMDFLDAGVLDVSLVYHPGWEIEHQLESEGRAMRLWPRDPGTPLDIGALPPVDSNDLRWSVGPRLQFTPGAFNAAAALDPLSITTDLYTSPVPGVFAVSFG